MVAKFGGTWPGDIGIAKTWNVPKYNVDLSRATGARSVDIADGISVDKSLGFVASFTGRLPRSSANTAMKIISPNMIQNTLYNGHCILNQKSHRTCSKKICRLIDSAWNVLRSIYTRSAQLAQVSVNTNIEIKWTWHFNWKQKSNNCMQSAQK